MENILQGLNASQLEAVTSTEGFIRVIAGAGSGKTRALARRFAYLVNEIGILPGNILCVTFTNKSANEMRQRIHNLTGDNDTGYISTFHSFCVSVLQEDSHALQYPKSFLVLDNSDIDSMLKIIYEERGLTLRNMTFSKARDMIEIRKLIKEPEYYLDEKDSILWNKRWRCLVPCGRNWSRRIFSRMPRPCCSTGRWMTRCSRMITSASGRGRRQSCCLA